ncbi:9315_t:CDS:2, partial [Racocetra persica]
LGYKKDRAYATPMLTEKHIQQRINWVKKYLNHNWDQTVFSDETAFSLFRDTVEYWYKDKQPIRKIPKEKKKFLAWGAFWSKSQTSLYCFRRIMDAPFYVNILENHFPEIRSALGSRWEFQQDNDPSTQVDLLRNNVEKWWPKNLDELERFMTEEWKKILYDVLRNLARSMRYRCQYVLDNNGDH